MDLKIHINGIIAKFRTLRCDFSNDCSKTITVPANRIGGHNCCSLGYEVFGHEAENQVGLIYRTRTE